MIINQEIVEKYFYKIYDQQDCIVFNWVDRPQYNRVDVLYLASDYNGSTSIEYSTIIQGERDDKLNNILK